LALDLAREHRPDLVVLDLHLPDIPGEEVLRALKADPQTRMIPVAVISADVTAAHREAALAAGATAYLAKPFEVTTFLRLVDEALGNV
ncbi:MAG: response regulator, partial [Candidatus Rokuibacteriota bacterium]